MRHDDLLISFYGDDFTGSTDAMESLTCGGLRTVLFTSAPTPQQLARYPGIRAFGVAGMTRSMPPDEMERVLRPALASLRASGTPIVHYKVCSTFDSSPTIGSIGRVIDIGMDVFGAKRVPLLVAAPSLGRYCVFGNLFARCGPESDVYRLDRHPSMSRHPITPMDEADLRRHLAKQTRKSIGLFDILQIDRPDAAGEFDRVDTDVVLIDLLYDRQLAPAGGLIDRCDKPTFMVGSSGVEAALCAQWQRIGIINRPHVFPPLPVAGPIIAICGSCSPVTAAQIEWALAHGFAEVVLDVCRLDQQRALEDAVKSLGADRSVVIHTNPRQRHGAADNRAIGPALGGILRGLLDATKVRRVIVAGGDTSGQVAAALGIESMEMIAQLTPGAPLCRARAPDSPADGIEITFKGGQIGKEDFFGLVQRGQ